MSRGGAEVVLTKWLVHEKRVVTFRLLSREIGCHVYEAQSHLEHFYRERRQGVEDEKSAPHATWLISGIRDGIQTMLVVPEERLQVTKDSFDSITNEHIYSLQPHRLADYSLLTTCSDDLISDPKYTEKFAQSANGRLYGMIQCSEVKRVQRSTNGFDSAGPVFSARSVAITNAKDGVGAGQAKAAPSNGKTTQAQSRPANIFARSESSEKKSSLSESSRPVLPTAKSSVKSRTGSKDSKVQKTEPPTHKSSTKRRQIEDSDDEMDDRQTEEDRAALAEMMEIDDPEPEVAPEPAVTAGPAKAPVTKTIGGRRKKKIKVKKTYKNAKGYTVTEDVEEWVSASDADEAAPKGKTDLPANETKTSTKAAASSKSGSIAAKPPASSAPARKQGKQGSIMSFFGKK